MTEFVPDPRILRQWEQKVARWITHGRTRAEIILDMTAANWGYADADQFVRKIAFRQRRKYVIVMGICAVFASLGIAITFISLTGRNGGVFYVPIGFTVGFIYALVRLVSIRA